MKEMLRYLALFILLVLCVVPGALAFVAMVLGLIALGASYALIWAGVLIWKR
jgi:hypothetical protein